MSDTKTPNRNGPSSVEKAAERLAEGLGTAPADQIQDVSLSTAGNASGLGGDVKTQAPPPIADVDDTLPLFGPTVHDTTSPTRGSCSK